MGAAREEAAPLLVWICYGCWRNSRRSFWMAVRCLAQFLPGYLLNNDTANFEYGFYFFLRTAMNQPAEIMRRLLGWQSQHFTFVCFHI